MKISFFASTWTFFSIVAASGIYTGKSPVIQVDARSYDSLIAQSNHTSIVEFYAPWCGHCQNLKPAYEKAAKSLAGLAKVAAINCDEEANKPLCAQFSVQGFPTLKIVKPGKKPGKPVVEDYQGQRTAKAIVDAVIDKIPNHVKRLQDSNIDTWLGDKSGVKAILFTEKGTTAPLFKAVAVDFLGSVQFAQVRSKEAGSVERYGVSKFPTIVLIDGKNEPVLYSKEMKKEAIVEFLAQVAKPNPDPSSKKAKASSPPKKSKSAKPSAKSAFSEASEAQKSSEFDDHMAHASTSVEEENVPTESPMPIVEHDEKPIKLPNVPPPIPTLATGKELDNACLQEKSGNCVLLLLPKQDTSASPSAESTEALSAFADLAESYHKRKANVIPFYAIPVENENAPTIRQSLGLKTDADLQVVALNMKRGWWRQYTLPEFDIRSVENFVDNIRFGEGEKHKLPANFFVTGEVAEDLPAEATPDNNDEDYEFIEVNFGSESEEISHDEL